MLGSSPHTRGAPAHEGLPRRAEGIIPAYAGSTRTPRRSRCGPRDHPRIRGEHYRGGVAMQVLVGSSPHTRGALLTLDGGKVERRIIPAYAGSTPSKAGSTLRWRDHPRIRGEHLCACSRRIVCKGSSPHTRGAPGGGGLQLFYRGIIPAYAGSTFTKCGSLHLQRDHPRIRREHRQQAIREHAELESSPHTRGAPPPSPRLT